MRDEIVKRHRLGANESLFKIAVNYARSFGGVASVNRPRAHFFFARGEIGFASRASGKPLESNEPVRQFLCPSKREIRRALRAATR